MKLNFFCFFLLFALLACSLVEGHKGDKSGKQEGGEGNGDKKGGFSKPSFKKWNKNEGAETSKDEKE